MTRKAITSHSYNAISLYFVMCCGKLWELWEYATFGSTRHLDTTEKMALWLTFPQALYIEILKWSGWCPRQRSYCFKLLPCTVVPTIIRPLSTWNDSNPDFVGPTKDTSFRSLCHCIDCSLVWSCFGYMLKYWYCSSALIISVFTVTASVPTSDVMSSTVVVKKEQRWIPWRSVRVKEDKALLLLGHTELSIRPSFFPLFHTQTHTGGRGDASVGTKVFPLCKLKPLITNWENRGEGKRGTKGRRIEGT